MSNWVGQTLGKVRIDALLARGGMAEVYIGTHTTLQREVAVKILRNNYDEQPHTLERFQREAMVVGKLRHPNIVQVFDFDTTTDSQPYLVMEYIKGPSLLKYLNALHTKKERLEFPHVVRLMDAMTSALQYAHDNGVIHRDIKPGNILLTSRSSQIIPGKPFPEDFEPVLTDFGLVRFLDSTEHTTGSGQIAGTPAYMSPEQARGELTDGRTDIYSLGIVLYEILAGHLPFQGETTMGVLMKHINEPPAPVPDLPPSMQLVLDRALAKDVNDRFQTPAEFGEAFSSAVENRGDYSTVDLNAGPIAAKKTKKKPPTRIFGGPKPQQRWIRPALAAVVVVAVGASVLLSGFPSLSPGTPTASVTSTATTLATAPSSTSTRTPPPIISLGRTGVLQFQNGSAFADQVSLVAEALLAPPAGSQYEVWLVNGSQRISLGVLTLDANGRGTLTYKQEQELNLVSLYNSVQITIEPEADSDPKSSGVIAYSYTFQEEGLVHVRNILSSFPDTPNKTALIQGLYEDVKLIDEFAKEIQKASNNGNEARLLLNAEAILNIIVGSQSPNYRDLNNDGQVDDPGNGYGLQLNGRNLGYFQAIYTEANSAVNSVGPTEPMFAHGEGLKVSIENLAQWTTELQDLITVILNSQQDDNTKQLVAEVVALADKMLNGIDLDENGKMEAVAGEGGAQTAYDEAYHMADMPLEMVGVVLNTGTGTPVFSLATPTKSAGGGTGSGNTAPTARAKPTQKPKDPKDPPGKPPNKNNNSSNNSNP